MLTTILNRIVSTNPDQYFLQHFPDKKYEVPILLRGNASHNIVHEGPMTSEKLPNNRPQHAKLIWNRYYTTQDN